MYRNAYQRGLLTVFYSGGSKPLNIWEVRTQDGYVSRFLDPDIKSMVLEIGGTNVSTTYITCPKGNLVLGITMPFLVMIVKNLKKYFSFEVTIMDETSTRRRFRVSNFQSTTQILPLCTVMPIGLSEGWNQIQFNLAEFTRRAYKKQFVEVQKIKINANIRLRRIYFAERLLPEEELPADYKLYFPLSYKQAKDKTTLTQDAAGKENIKPSTSQQIRKASEPVPIEGATSKTRVLKQVSKTSVHSIKKVPSHVSAKESKTQVIPEGEATAAEEAPGGEIVSEKTEQTAEEQQPAEGENVEPVPADDSNAPVDAPPPTDADKPETEPEQIATEAEPTAEPQPEPQPQPEAEATEG